MYCRKCGIQMKSGQAFCTGCGTSVNGGGANVTPQYPAANTNTSTKTPYSPALQQTRSAAAPIKKPIRINKKVAAIAAALIVVVAGVFIFNAIQENQFVAAEQERIEQDKSEIEHVLLSYAAALSERNYEYASRFCVEGYFDEENFMDGSEVGGFDLGNIFDGLLGVSNAILEGIMGDLEFDFDRSDIAIDGMRASVQLTMILPDWDAEEEHTFTLAKTDGTWLIENPI